MPSNEPLVDGIPLVSFVPREDYISKNLKPETIDRRSVEAAAAETRNAVNAGILRPKTAELVLANILTENRSADFGVNPGSFWSKNPAVARVIKALGMEKSVQSGEDFDSDAKVATARGGSVKYVTPAGMLKIEPKFGLDANGTPTGTTDFMAHNAKLMAAVLGIKDANSASPEDTIKRWNGVGPGAENHLKKVLQVHEMLKRPENSEVVKTFREAYNKQSK